MLDATVITAINLHLSLPELLAILAIPSGTWWAWKSRYGLARAVTALCRRSLPDGRQEAARQIPAPSDPPDPAGASKGVQAASLSLL